MQVVKQINKRTANALQFTKNARVLVRWTSASLRHIKYLKKQIWQVHLAKESVAIPRVSTLHKLKQQQQQWHAYAGFCIRWPEPRVLKSSCSGCRHMLNFMCPVYILHKSWFYILCRYQPELHFPACTYLFFLKCLLMKWLLSGTPAMFSEETWAVPVKKSGALGNSTSIIWRCGKPQGLPRGVRQAEGMKLGLPRLCEN